MAQTALKPWTLDEFFAWQERQDERYELVGGVPLRMMAGVSNRHDEIVVNLISALRSRLRGSGCFPFTGESGLETYPGQIRRPDLGIDCGRRDPAAYRATGPRLVVEVLSPSTRDFDTFEKLAEYKAVETLDTIVYVEPNRAEISVWRRVEDRSWTRDLVEGLQAVIHLPGLGIDLPLADIYEDVEFDAPSRPVSVAGP